MLGRPNRTYTVQPNRSFMMDWKSKRRGCSVIVRFISKETDHSPWSRRAEIVHSLCGQQERTPSKS
jgi:hypothetical protein